MLCCIAYTVFAQCFPCALYNTHIHTQVRALGIPAALLGFVATGVFRGFKDTRTPLLGVATSVAVSFGLHVLFLNGEGLGRGAGAWRLQIPAQTKPNPMQKSEEESVGVGLGRGLRLRLRLEGRRREGLLWLSNPLPSVANSHHIPPSRSELPRLPLPALFSSLPSPPSRPFPPRQCCTWTCGAQRRPRWRPLCAAAR